MTDLQAAGLAWLLKQNYFTLLAAGPFTTRIRTLDRDYFSENRDLTIQSILEFGALGLAISLLNNFKLAQCLPTTPSWVSR